MSALKRILTLLLVADLVFFTVNLRGKTADIFGKGDSVTNEPQIENPEEAPEEAPEEQTPAEKTQEELWAEQYDCITVAKALELCEQFENAPSTARYYIIATVKSVDNPTYGQLTVEDATGSITVYGTYSSDGSVRYDAMGEKPTAGDVVLIYGTLQNYQGETKEVQNARLIDFYTPENEIDEGDYVEMTVADARVASDGTLVKTAGVVARITYANGKIPSGFFLIDGTDSIYVYDGDAAIKVKEGNKVTILATKDHWILDTEKSNAEKFGYKGCNQLTGVTVVSNDKGSHDFDKSWITESTVKQIMDTPFTEDITTTIYKVTALIRKVPGSGFVNYYIDDLDGVTGTYTYTQCNGADFDWLDEFDGKICTVYLSALNAKSTSIGCNWRFIPVAVIDEGFEFDVNDAPEFVIDYFGIPAFESSYMVGAKVELPTDISSDILNFTGATLSYSVSDDTVASITAEDGKTYFNTLAQGRIEVTVTAAHNGNSAQKTIAVTVITQASYDSITVREAIEAENNTEVTVRGIVGPSAVNQAGTFYLIDGTGSIPVKGVSADEIMKGLSIGDEIVVRGTRTITKDGGGQIVIGDAEILANYYGENNYSTDSFIKDMTISEIKAVQDSPEATVNVYVLTAAVTRSSVQQGSYTNVTFNVDGLLLYTGSASQYAWIAEYFEEGESSGTFTLELALCDWNAKGLKGCVLSITLDDGTKVYNTTNFN